MELGSAREVPEPEGSWAGEIVLKLKNADEPLLFSVLIQSGAACVIAASGFNLTIAAKPIFESCLCLVVPGKTMVLGRGGVWVYVLIAQQDWWWGGAE